MLVGGIIKDSDDPHRMLYPGLSEAQFLSSALGKEAEEDIVNGSYRSYDLPALVIHRAPFSARVFFDGGRLKRIQLFRKSNNDVSWSNWSEERERDLKKLNDQFLIEVLGVCGGVYDWGRVESVFDRKSGSSSIVVSFV